MINEMYRTIISSSLKSAKKVASNHPHDGRIIVIDNYKTQVQELLELPDGESTFPSISRSKGSWVIYPWHNRIVHVLNPEEYYYLRTSRNRFLLSISEQERYKDFRPLIAGLSVGYSIAVALVLEGAATEIVLTDPDTLGISNLNRIPQSTINLGLNKAIIASRSLYEIDPYINVKIVSKIKHEVSAICNVLKKNRITHIVEETDDMEFKYLLRCAAKKLRIPLVMATALDDTLLVDFEDYQVPDQKIFNGLLPRKDLKVMTSKNLLLKKKYATKIVGMQNFSERLNYSFSQLGKKISAFPQYGSGAFLRAAAVVTLLRKIAQGKKVMPGRYAFSFSDFYK